MVVSKRLKTEVLEDENEREVRIGYKLLFIFVLRVRSASVVVLQGSEKNINRVENRAECEISTAEDYQTVGMNIDVLRMKLVSQQLCHRACCVF